MTQKNRLNGGSVAFRLLIVDADVEALLTIGSIDNHGLFGVLDNMTSSDHLVDQLVSGLRVVGLSLQASDSVSECIQFIHGVFDLLLLDELLLLVLLDLLFRSAALAADLHQVAGDSLCNYIER